MTIKGNLTVGVFIINLDVYQQMCTSWNTVYADLLVINSALPAMEHVTRYLNLPIDLDKRRQANNRRREMNQEERIKARANMKQGAKTEGAPVAMYASDTIPLKLRSVSFVY